MEEVDDGDNNEVEEIVWDNFTFQFDASESTGNIENYTWDLEMETYFQAFSKSQL